VHRGECLVNTEYLCNNSIMASEPLRPTVRGGEPDQLRLLAKIARMYHEQGIRQPQIAADLNISQSRVSRLLKQAADIGIVRTVVTLPVGVYTDTEQELERRFGLLDSVIVDTAGPTAEVMRALGASAATYLEETLGNGDAVGISSWSATLLATVDAMRPKNGLAVEVVTQLSGGIGDPHVQVDATRLLDRFATLTGGRPLFLPTPGMVNSPNLRRALLDDPAVQGVREVWNRLTVAIVGIGTVQPSPLLERSGNAIDPAQQQELRALGAVGDVCYRFFDKDGQLITSPFNDRILGIDPDQLKAAHRRIGVAGGPDKFPAIAAALKGRWINTLITDLETAERLLKTTPERGA
jgi:DNA-binding transcriptional regulator LsrR (DeoR family)